MVTRRALHRRHPAAWIVLGGAALVTLDAAAWLVYVLAHVVSVLAPAVLLGLGIWWWRRRGGPSRPLRVVRGSVVPPAGPGDLLAQVTAERDDLRRQVAKLEDDAARTEGIVEELEDAAGRPIEAVLASYKKIQKLYGDRP